MPRHHWNLCGFKSFSQLNDLHIPSKQRYFNAATCLTSSTSWRKKVPSIRDLLKLLDILPRRKKLWSCTHTALQAMPSKKDKITLYQHKKYFFLNATHLHEANRCPVATRKSQLDLTYLCKHHLDPGVLVKMTATWRSGKLFSYYLAHILLS